MNEREIHFYRCPGKKVAFESVIAGGAVYHLDEQRICPLCGTLVARHDSFTLRTCSDERDGWPEADAA